MATSADETNLVDWKKLWLLVSGIYYETPMNIVKDRLLEASKELQDGVLQYKKCTTTGSDLEAFMKKKGQEKLFPFTYKLQQLLDIESSQCWEILCYYLVNEYRGSAHSLTNFISTEANMAKLLNDIWGYYSLERMVALKVVKNILEFYKSPKNPYSIEYKIVVDKITLKLLRKSYVEQLEYLIKENPPTRLAAGEFFNYQTKLVAWAERKQREVNEILQILTLIIHYDGIEPNEILRVFECFKLHGFGKQQRYLEYSNDVHCDLMQRITLNEVVLFLKCMDFNESDVSSTWLPDVTKLLEKHIIQLNQNPEHGPILLSWMLRQFRSLNLGEDDEAAHKYRKLGSRAVQLGVFDYLNKLVSHHMFKDQSLVSRIARKTIYNHITHLCDLFDSDGSVAQHVGIYELLSSLLSWPSIASEFCINEEGGVRSLFNTALENFPLEFIPLSLIANALSTAGKSQSSYIRKQLDNLPIYAETYSDSKVHITPLSDSDEDDFVLTHDYTPFRRIDFVIKEGTTGIIVDKKNCAVVHFRTNLSYFNVLHNEINLLLGDSLHYTDIDENRVRRVDSGIKYLISAIKNIENPAEISNEMVHPTEMVIDILNKLKIIQHPLIHELLANCLNVCESLLPLFENEIVMRVINLNILPCMSNETLDFKKYSHGVCFDSNLIGYYLVNFEKNQGRYDFLVAYLNFLTRYFKLRKNRLFAMEIPGLIFLLREVFPHIHSWRFESQTERNKIYTLVMQYFFDILQITNSQIKECQTRQILRDICVYSLLNLDNGVILLKFVAVGNPLLQGLMENETNWMTSGLTGLNLLVQLSMTILMQLLRLKSTVLEISTLSPLESIIYTQPKQRDTLRIIPVVTSYISNIFNRRLPVLSCRLLRRFAVEFKMSLLACLDMEPDQIRLTFLQCLPDDLESDNLKIAVLDLVEACIEKQPGLTEAFFKINYEKEKRFLFKEKKTSNIGDSILTYMEEYLQAILCNPKTVASPLLSRIMSLFHSLWKNNMQILVKDLMEKPTFWPSLCNPLYGTIHQNVKAYSQLFNILGIELFCLTDQSKINNDLKTTIDKFLKIEYFDKWIDSIFDIPQSSIEEFIEEETPEWLCRLQSFKDLLIILLRKKPQHIEVPKDSLKYLASECLRILVERAEYTDDFRPFIILAELYLIILLNFQHKYTDNETEDREMLSQIKKLLNSVALYYDDIHLRSRESCLAIAIRSVDILSSELMKDSLTTIEFLQPMIDILCSELRSFEICVMAEIKGENLAQTPAFHENSMILSLNLLKSAAGIFQNGGPDNWEQPFITSKIFNRILTCASWALPLSSRHRLTVEILDILIVFAKGNCSTEFLYCDVSDYLWLKFLPPKELLQMPFTSQETKETSWTPQNWWPIYSRGIELVTLLLVKHTHTFKRDALVFVGVHEEYLMDSLLLAMQSLEPKAMVLIKNTAEFISELIVYEKDWRLEHSQSLFNLIKCTQMVLEYGISLLYRPDSLKRLTDKNSPGNVYESTNVGLSDNTITAMNDLVEVITLCAKTLIRFSPSLLELIAEPQFLTCKWEPLIEIYFGAPKLDAGNYPPQLTFGTLLNAVNIFTKALNSQNHSFHETALNTLPGQNRVHDDITSLPGSESVRRSFTPTANTLSNVSSPRTPFVKSLSMTSATSFVSSNTPSNEILLNLECNKCVTSLEHVLTLLAAQTLLALKSDNLSNEKKQLIRREIKPVLMIHQDFERKKVLTEYKINWHRKKFGCVMMLDLDNEIERDLISSKSSTSGTGHKSSLKQSMRVSVVKRLHLQSQQQLQPSPPATTSRRTLEMSHVISPISGSSSSNIKSDLNIPMKSSTPSTGSTKRVSFVDDCAAKKVCADDNDMIYFEPEEPKYSPLSFVKLIEEDYLQFLYNLFSVICQKESSNQFIKENVFIQ